MTIELLQKIKAAAGGKQLSFLVIDNKTPISPRALAALATFGKTVITVENAMELSKVSTLFRGNSNVTVVIASKTPIQEYDVVIGYAIDSFVSKAVTWFKPKYVMSFVPPAQGFSFDGYYEIDRGCYKLDMGNAAETQQKEDEKNVDSTQKMSPEKTTEIIDAVDENSEEYYEPHLLSASTHVETPEKPAMRWFNEMVKGRISLVLTLTGDSGNGGKIIANFKAQKIPDSEIIVVDNASKLRSNVKIAAKFSTQIPADVAKQIAKQMSTGEYIIELDQDSEPVDDIMGMVQRGECSAREE